jgi:hypothetical protein
MWQEQMPSAPEWMDLEVPPPEAEVTMVESDRPLAPGFVSFEGMLENDMGQRFRVRASAEDDYRAALECYAESLHLLIAVVPDPPDLRAGLAELDALPGGAVEATLELAKETGGAFIILETEPMFAGNSVTWANKWSTLGADKTEYWHGKKWAKLSVNIGSMDLRGIVGNAATKGGGEETGWWLAEWHCHVHAFKWTQYRLNAGWHT